MNADRSSDRAAVEYIVKMEEGSENRRKKEESAILLLLLSLV